MSNRKGQISISMMCVGLDQTQEYLNVIKKTQIEWLHIDVMDGVFVPNFTLGPDYVNGLRRLSDVPFDFHFMVEEPEVRMKWFDIRPGDFVSVHYESTRHLDKCLQYIKDIGAKPMVAINPATPINVIEEVIDHLNGVLIMTVNPGFAGQKLVINAETKVAKMRKYLDELGRNDVLIQTDGNMSNENMKKMFEAGADIFVAGTSSIIKPLAEGAEDRIALSRHAIGF